MGTNDIDCLIIGVGNEDRGDDGAGLAVARRARDAAPATVRVCESNGDGAALLNLWQGADAVWLVDAVRSGAPPGAMHRVDVHATALPSYRFGSSSHAFGVAQAVELARQLHRLPARFTIIGIEGRNFSLGSRMSPEVAQAVELVVQELLSHCPVCSPPS